MSKTAFKHVLLTSDKTETNLNTNKYDLVTITQLKTTPDIIKFQKIDPFRQIQTHKTQKPTINKQLSTSNSNSMISSSFKTQTTSATKTRILVKRQKPIELRSFTKLSFFNQNESANYFPQENNQTENTSIKQNILGSMTSYGNFINNPLTSNQSLVDPNYYQNLLGMKSRTFYLVSAAEELNIKSESCILKKSNIDELKQQQQQNNNQKILENNPDNEKNDYVCTTSILHGINDNKNTTRKTDGNIKSHETTEISQKRVYFSDTDSKDAVKDLSSNASNINTVNQLSKNMFLNYKPPNQQTLNSSNSSTNEKLKVENVLNNSNNQNEKTTNNVTTSNNNNNKKFIRRNSILSNQITDSKKSIAFNKSKTTIEITQISTLKHNPEKYLDKFTLVRIEKWVQDVNNQNRII
jgi:hypothetical protein